MEKTGRVVVITGAARGIGQAIAKRFLANGDKVAILDVLVDVAQEWTADVEDAFVVKCDITDKADIEAAKAQVLEHFGRVDVLVNNAGVVPKPNLLENIPEADWKRAFDINVNGTFFCTLDQRTRAGQAYRCLFGDQGSHPHDYQADRSPVGRA